MPYATETLILKWHPISERPSLHRDVIVKHTGANPVLHPCDYIAADNLADLGRYDEFHEWSYAHELVSVRSDEPDTPQPVDHDAIYAVRRARTTHSEPVYLQDPDIPLWCLLPDNALRMTRQQAELVRIRLGNYYSDLLHRLHKSGEMPTFEIVELSQSGHVEQVSC